MKYFDLHCDTILNCAHKDIPLRDNEMHVSLKKAEPIETYVQCYAVFLPDSIRGEAAFDFFCRAADRLALETERNADLLAPCREAGDLQKIEKAGKHGAVLTVESAAALGGKLENIEEFKRRGVRMCTLTWSGENELGRGVRAEGKTGLTPFGREVVRGFEEAGVIVDISHASPELFWDVAEMARKPIVASHSNSKVVCDHARNLTDEQFLAIKKTGGLVGLNFYTEFLHNEPEKASMEDLLRHAEHFLSLGGEKVLAMGSDFDGSDMPEDMKDGLAAVPRLYELFLRHYSQELTHQIFYGNAARFFQERGLL